MIASKMVRVGVVVLMLVGMTAACTKEQAQEFADDTVELAARKVAEEGGAQKFSDEGIEVEGDLACTATSDVDSKAVSVDCTGTSTDGQDLTLTGQLSVADGEIVDSSGFVGTADGEEVFSADCVGEACSLGS